MLDKGGDNGASALPVWWSVHAALFSDTRRCMKTRVIQRKALKSHTQSLSSQFFRENASTTSKILRSAWRRSPFKITLKYPSTRFRMATNAASYNPSKEFKCYFCSAILTIT